MKKAWLAAGAAVLTLFLTAEARAFRCGKGLVVIGDGTGKVLMECGPPTSKEGTGTATAAKVKQEKKAGSGKATANATPSSRTGSTGKVERWFYNCGDHDLVYVLTFEGGVLTKEETQGHGRGRSDCQGRR
jgi:hypothetical protein